MVRAAFAFRRGEGVLALEMEGHAGYSPGNDIVCAGCSAIAYALLGYAHNAGARGQVRKEETAPGHLLLECAGDEGLFAAGEMAAIGLMQLQKAYPGHVQVTAEGL